MTYTRSYSDERDLCHPYIEEEKLVYTLPFSHESAVSILYVLNDVDMT